MSRVSHRQVFFGPHAANDELQRLYASFEAVAKEMNVHLEVGSGWVFQSGGYGDRQHHGGASQLSSRALCAASSHGGHAVIACRE